MFLRRASNRPDPYPRGFKEINVANFSSQQPTDRYPNLGNDDEVEQPDDNDDDDGPVLPNGPPHVARWRSNLCALSKTHNLYFVAVFDKIHISVPRGLKQTIPGNSDLILALPVTEDAVWKGGYMDDLRPHCVNNMFVGNLGTLEVIMMGCDDGDVLVFYTHLLHAAVSSENNPSKTSKSSLMPFFHENVGCSVWGLAIHAQSRMIAVSSNLKQVTVFSFGAPSSEEPEYHYENKYPDIEMGGDGRFIRDKIYNARVVIPLDGDNIPSIDFASDGKGDAVSILAIDIHGTLWILGLFDESREKIRSIHSTGDSTPLRRGKMGWGVLAIPLAMSKKTSTPAQALGLLENRLKAHIRAGFMGEQVDACFDISNTIIAVQDSTTRHPSLPQPFESPEFLSAFPTSSALVLDDDSELTVMPIALPKKDRPKNSFEILRETCEQMEKQENERQQLIFRHLVNCVPRAVMDEIEDTKALIGTLEKVHDENHECQLKEKPEYYLAEHVAILRIHECDVELMPPAKSMPRTICKNIVQQHMAPELIAALSPYERLIFNASIPELSLVVVASQVGRAALITITRPGDSFSRIGPIMTFRIDFFLPLKQHDQADHRPISPLLGMAVAPLQAHPKSGGSRRWRLLLHYYDSTILSYELSRNDTHDLLVL